MPSPFPGMDPYLEKHWGDVHHGLMTYARDQIRGRLPKNLHARLEESVYVQSLELIIEISEPITQGHIEIRDFSSGDKLVTVIEALSLANKLPGEGQQKYRQKQQELRDGGVSLVEIDLLRAGQRVLPFPLERLPKEKRTPYLICVRRGCEPVAVEIYPVSLRGRLPAIRVPLRQTDADIPLDLQPLIDQCYLNGDYEADIDYQLEAQPALTGADSRWADSLLRKAGRRSRKVRRNS